MSNQEKKEYLCKYRNVCIRLVNLQEQLTSFYEVEQSAKAHQLSDMPRSQKRKKDLSDVMVRIEQLKDTMDDKIIESLKLRTDIETIILNVKDDTERMLLRLRYIEFMKWEDICQKMMYSRQQVYRIHNKAIKNLNMLHIDTSKCDRI